MTVDELKIVIEAETSQARKQLKDILDAVHELADAAGIDLDGAFSDAEAGIRSSTDSIKNKVKDATKDTESNLKSMANTANKTSKSVKGGASAMGQEFGELAKRLSLAHLLVEAIEKSIEWVAKTLKESVETLSKFDSGISKTYGNFKNSFGYMKNSITGAIAPLVSQVLPVVTKILNAIGDALNSLSRKIAIITGAKSYITAKKSVDGYTESVKNLKKAFASFDELDTLSSLQDQTGLEDLYETELIDYSNLSEAEKSLRRIGEMLGFISKEELSPIDTENLNYVPSIGESIKSAFDDARASIASTWDLLKDTGALKSVVKIVSDLVSAMATLFGWVSRTWIKFTSNVAVRYSLKKLFRSLEELSNTLSRIIRALFRLDDNDTLSNLVSGSLASSISGISKALSIVADGVTGLIKSFETLAFTIGFVVDSLEKIVTLNFDAVPNNWEEYKKGLSEIWGDGNSDNDLGNSLGNSLPEDIYGPPAPTKPAKPAPAKPAVEKSFIEKLGTNIVKSILTPIGPFFGIRNGISAILKDLGVPGFANGGVVTSPTVALLGEYSGAGKNPEIAAPSSMIKSIVDESNNSVVSTLIQCCRQLITAIDEKDTTTYIGDDEVANAAQRGNRKYYNRTGKPLIAIGV